MPGSPFAAEGLGPFGGEFRPTNAAQLYVSNTHDGPNAGTVSAFTDSTDGTLTAIAGSPFPDNQTAPCWVEISHDGQYLFTVNTLSKSVSSYSIATDGSLTLLQSAPVNAPAATPQDARLSPDGTTLWGRRLGSRHRRGFAVNGGTLTELPSSPTHAPVGAHTRWHRRYLTDPRTSRVAPATARMWGKGTRFRLPVPSAVVLDRVQRRGERHHTK
jgi:hypothetical protein